MKKKISAILVAILLCSVSGATVVLATKSETVTAIDEWKASLIPSYPTPKYPDVKMAKGVAVDKSTLETEPVVFLIMNYRGEVSTYLFIDGKFYEMEEIERSGSWETGTKVFKYESNDGSIMTIIIQNFDSYGIVSIAAEFKNYLINFEPIYRYGGEPVTTSRIIGVTEKPVYEEIAKKLKQVSGIKIEDIFSKQTGQITEWVE